MNPSKKQKQIQNRFKKMIKLAKSIQKNNPNTSWKQCLKQAGQKIKKK